MDPNWNETEFNKARERVCSSCEYKYDSSGCINSDYCTQRTPEQETDELFWSLKESKCNDAVTMHGGRSNQSIDLTFKLSQSDLESSGNNFSCVRDEVDSAVTDGESIRSAHPFATMPNDDIILQHQSQNSSDSYIVPFINLQAQPINLSPLLWLQRWNGNENEATPRNWLPPWPSQSPLFAVPLYALPSSSLESPTAHLIVPNSHILQNPALSQRFMQESHELNSEQNIKSLDASDDKQITEDPCKTVAHIKSRHKQIEVEQPSTTQVETETPPEDSKQKPTPDTAAVSIRDFTEEPNARQELKRVDRKRKAVAVSRCKPKRSLTAYNLFFMEERRKLLKENCHKQSVGFHKMGQTISARWRNLNPKYVTKYKALATADRARYEKEMMEYRAWKEEQLTKLHEKLLASVDDKTKNKYFNQG